ncbi:hypothetical protein KFL_005130020 [Klebsormidium nitens]|uniref:Uncharacterized protein n=1 Tax=Klebsormidium nitens TaxID=105231 RepID=A0A1Y1IFF2_KLENI|nr:hypothetical protein KFL_005130020 [Klebsormidium nitens]|eukprot:GAQ89343.1 hypothetical protein KFL_005130020 [Klebsormidium nitens]
MFIIAQGCFRLNKLHLEWCCGISDGGLAAVLRGCSELTDLSLEFCGKVTGEAFSGLACKIEKLDLVACDAVKNEGLLAAATACSRLKELRVTSNQKGASLTKGVEGAAKFCKGLEALCIHACGLKDETLRSFATSCPLLSSASLSCEPAVTDGGLAAFLAGLPKLESLSLQHMDGLSGVPRVGASKRLKKLRLGYWWNAPDLFLRGLSEETTLEELRLECCPHLTDATVDSIFAGCRSLKLLVLLDNKLITAESIRAYLRHGKKSTLQILECPGATKENVPDDLRTVLQDVFP